MNFQAIEAFLELVQNPDKYKKMLASLKEQHDTVLAAIELTAPAKEIPDLHKKASEAVDKAKVEAENVVKLANAEAEGIVAKANDLLQKAQKEQDAIVATSAETKQVNTEAKRALAEVKERERKLALDEQAVKDQQAQLYVSQQEVSAKLAKLQEVLK
jgi:vacuolar-type H+-ATPase subunit E/Vma4